jgi:hypothetical protein
VDWSRPLSIVIRESPTFVIHRNAEGEGWARDTIEVILINALGCPFLPIKGDGTASAVDAHTKR